MSETVIDTCCLINLFASGSFRSILRGAGYSCHVPSAVFAEALFARKFDPDGDLVPEPILLQPFIDEGLLVPCTPADEEEMRRFVGLATDLDDGEAMGLAIAECRGWRFATDDRKARRFANAIGVSVLTTPEIMKRWSERAKLGQRQVAQALLNIEHFARFSPAEDLPDYEWWSGQMARPRGM